MLDERLLRLTREGDVEAANEAIRDSLRHYNTVPSQLAEAIIAGGLKLVRKAFGRHNDYSLRAIHRDKTARVRITADGAGGEHRTGRAKRIR